jgi:cell division protein FtsB
MRKWLILSLSLLFIGLQYRLWEGDGSIQDVIRLSKAIVSESEEVKKLSDRNHQLSLEVQALKDYPEALEERARAELGMIKQGETFCLVIDPSR